MQIPFLFFACWFLISISIEAIEEQSENLTLVFYVKHHDNPDIDYVELSLKLHTKDDSSLTRALKNAHSDVHDIKTLAQEFCDQHAKKKTDCKDIVDAGVYQIQPRYQLIRKSPVFMGFTITHEITIAVKSTQNIGHLVDKIKAKEGVTLNGFQWKASKKNKVSQEAIALGMKEGQGLCLQLNGDKSVKVISVNQVYGQDAEAVFNLEGKSGEEEEQEAEQDGTLSVFKFEVQCLGKSKTKKQ